VLRWPYKPSRANVEKRCSSTPTALGGGDFRVLKDKAPSLGPMDGPSSPSSACDSLAEETPFVLPPQASRAALLASEFDFSPARKNVPRNKAPACAMGTGEAPVPAPPAPDMCCKPAGVAAAGFPFPGASGEFIAVDPIPEIPAHAFNIAERRRDAHAHAHTLGAMAHAHALPAGHAAEGPAALPASEGMSVDECGRARGCAGAADDSCKQLLRGSSAPWLAEFDVEAHNLWSNADTAMATDNDMGFLVAFDAEG
jgi:hypothetical protein